MRDRDGEAAAVVSDLRRATGRFPAKGGRPSLSVRCTRNALFARPWAQGAVAAHREDRKTVDHPDADPVLVVCGVQTDGDLERRSSPSQHAPAARTGPDSAAPSPRPPRHHRRLRGSAEALRAPGVPGPRTRGPGPWLRGPAWVGWRGL
ncbi:hypothetical protein GCM10023224_42370 [Streptomonospora halophila]|uniref:MmyB-like transcription regulator ligand binding domain-containing protein n=1 Tax=Streptomonospora halophila TaxID=427369 RepID=A0ABP9H1S3_9ACTN